MLKEKFIVFINSSFSEDKKADLFAHIWKNYSKRISFYIANLIPPFHPHFEDLFQEVMMKIYNHLHTFNPSRSFKGWIYTIARNHCLDFLKQNATEIKAFLNISERKSPDGKNPEIAAVEEDIMEKIELFLEALDSRDREIAYLRFYENFKYREISSVINLNLNATKARIRLIKMELRKKLGRVL